MYTVLVIDDDVDMRTLMGVLLKRCGCNVISAANGFEGQKLALESHPDLILLDIMMEGQDGCVTCANLRALGHTGPILLISAIEARAGKHKSQECGADGYWQKPIRPAFLKEQIEVLRREPA